MKFVQRVYMTPQREARHWLALRHFCQSHHCWYRRASRGLLLGLTPHRCFTLFIPGHLWIVGQRDIYPPLLMVHPEILGVPTLGLFFCL